MSTCDQQQLLKDDESMMFWNSVPNDVSCLLPTVLGRGKGPVLRRGKGPVLRRGKGPVLGRGKGPVLRRGKEPVNSNTVYLSGGVAVCYPIFDHILWFEAFGSNLSN